MNRGRTREALCRPFERGDTPVANFVEIDVEGRLIELDNVDTCRLDCTRLVVQDAGECPSQLLTATVVGVVERVDHGHRPGQCVLYLALGCAAQEPGVLGEHRVPSHDRADDDRHISVVAAADAHGFLVLEIDAVEAFDQRRHEMAARLLAIGDDVDSGALLIV